MDHPKRESDCEEENSVLKKSKVDLLPGNTIGGTVEKIAADLTGRNEPLSEEISGNNHVIPKEEACVKTSQALNSSTGIMHPQDQKALTPSVRRLSVIDAAAAEDKGSRHTMEDAWVVLPDASLDFPGKLRCAHFAIYDGHGGRLAAEFAQKNLHQNVLSAGLPRELMDAKAAKRTIIEGFRITDESLLQESVSGGWLDGATAVCIWILGQTVLVANVGDAKAVVARSSPSDGSLSISDLTRCPLKSIVVTREHKAIYPQERARIQKAGGSIGSNGRLQGRLEVSRAFGDRQFKKVGVISTPDVHSFELTEREHFIILGCDGLWGVFGPSDAVEFVHKHLQDGLSATSVVRRLVKEAVRERRCKDNCTAIIIVFKHT